MVKRYTAKEDQIIKDNLHLSDAQIGEKLGRSASSIKDRRRTLGLVLFVGDLDR